MNLKEQWSRTALRDLDAVSNLLLAMADEIDRLKEEVERLKRNRCTCMDVIG